MIGSLVHRATGIGAAAALAFAILLSFVSCTAQTAPIYGSNTGLDATLRQAQAPPPRADTPREVRYASEPVLKILGTLDVDR